MVQPLTQDPQNHDSNSLPLDFHWLVKKKA